MYTQRFKGYVISDSLIGLSIAQVWAHHTLHIAEAEIIAPSPGKSGPSVANMLALIEDLEDRTSHGVMFKVRKRLASLNQEKGTAIVDSLRCNFDASGMTVSNRHLGFPVRALWFKRCSFTNSCVMTLSNLIVVCFFLSNIVLSSILLFQGETEVSGFRSYATVCCS